LIFSAAASHRPTPLDVNFTFTDNRIFIIFSDIPHFVRRDIFAFAKVILRLYRSDILFASSTAAGNITRLKAEYHCVAIELAVRRIELKSTCSFEQVLFNGALQGTRLASLALCLLRKLSDYRLLLTRLRLAKDFGGSNPHFNFFL